MARGILINCDLGVSMSTWGFNIIVESTRKTLSGNERAISNIYNALDNEGMEFIDLWTTERNDFNDFYKATKSAFRESGFDSNFLAEWQELIEKLEAGVRFENI
jgi:hypothetical protein